MRRLILLIAASVFLLNGCSQNEANVNIPKGKQELEERTALSEKVNILIPKGFEIMSEEIAKIKYPNDNRPELIYTNSSGSINLALNHTSTAITEDNIEDFLKSMKKTFENLFPSAEWYGDDIVDINGKTVGYLELLTPAIDTKVYNLIYFTEMENKVLMINFNCTEEEMDDWRLTGKEIMYSLIVQ